MNETRDRRPAGTAGQPTRAEALRRLDDFVPRAGRAYAATRNFDRGPHDRGNVSTLAPYVRCRLICEVEILRAVLAQHPPSSAEKFVQEVFWRTYWKGWLQSRPAVWYDYLRTLETCYERTETDADLGQSFHDAVAGRTGIDAFDAWARELVDTGYLHNHARMWFASVWIFTLRLPWELGADFFMRHLLCGDQASNTLSWRWVAGLHTRGKTYLARCGNIQRYTEGRFDPTGLASRAEALEGPSYSASPQPLVPMQVDDPEAALLVMHDDDAGIDTLPLASLDIRASVAITGVRGRSPRPVSVAVETFANEALRDALDRAPAGDPSAVIDATNIASATDALVARAARADVRLAIAPFAPVGPVRDALDALRPALQSRGIRLALLGRQYDAIAWPSATRGYFALRERIPKILSELGLRAQRDG